MRDVLSGVSKNGMGCFVPGCFVLHSESFLHFYIYHQTENRDILRPKIHKTRILPKVGNMTLLPNPGKPGFYGLGLPGRVISCQPCWKMEKVSEFHFQSGKFRNNEKSQ